VEARGGAGCGAVLRVPGGVRRGHMCRRFACLLLSVLSKPAATSRSWHTQKTLRDNGLCVRRKDGLSFVLPGGCDSWA
jgi:hypothetical protein